MVFKLIIKSVILCFLSTISCDSICDVLQLNNESIDFAFTKYYGSKSVENIHSKHILVINDKVWNIRVNGDRVTIEGKNNTNNSEAISYEDFDNEMIKDNYKIAFNVLDENRNVVYRNIEIYFNGTTFHYSMQMEDSFTLNANQYNISVPFSALSVAFIPDSFRHEFDKQLSVVFVEQKSQNELKFERKFYILKFDIISVNEVNITLEDPNNLPVFLAQIPDTYYINGILNTYDYKLRCKTSNICSFSAIVLLTVNSSLKYCITSEVELSKDCLGNLQPLIDCDSMQTTSITTTTEMITTTIISTLNLMTTSIKPKEKYKNGVFVTIIIILSVILIVCIISCLSAYLIYRYCAKKQSKRRIVIKGNKNTEEIEEQKKNENENDLTKETDILLKEESQETFGFDTTDQKTLDLNEPIYVRNKQ